MEEIMEGKFSYKKLLGLMPFASNENANIIPIQGQDNVYPHYNNAEVEDVQMAPFPPSLPDWVDFYPMPHINNNNNSNNYIEYFPESSIPQVQMEMPSLACYEPEAASDFDLAESSIDSYVTKGNRSSASHSAISSLYSRKPRDPISRKRATEVDRSRILKNAERIEALNKLLPNPKEVGKALKLEEVIEHVKYLQHRIKELSQSRLIGESTSDPFIYLEGHGHYLLHELMMSNDSLEVEMGKLMQEKPLEAIQLLQRKGLFMMPVHLAQYLY